MKEYLKMDDVFDLPIKESEIMWMVAHDSPDRLECAVHAINSHDALVVEVERLSSSLNHANSNHELFERQYYLEKDKADGLQLEVEQLQQEVERLNSMMLERTQEPGPY